MAEHGRVAHDPAGEAERPTGHRPTRPHETNGEAGITKLATIQPTAMIALYANPELKGVAEDVETTLDRVMAEAAR